jgi:uncharacterized membrane protein YsdA (DUF1294 family)
VWFRRGRLLMVSPDSMGTACPLSGRNSTYRPVQISGTGSVYPHTGASTVLFVVTKNIRETGFIALAPSIRSLMPWAFQEGTARERDLTLVLLSMVGGAFLAPLAMVALTHKSIQDYHFVQQLNDAVVLGVFLTIAMIMLSSRLRGWIVVVAAVALAATGAAQIMQDVQAAVGKTTQQRVWGFPAMPNYRNDLAGLLRELDSEKYLRYNVLGTFDQQLSMLWITKRDHTLFIPDTFLSLVSDRLIEERTIALSKLVGMSEEEFNQKANENYFQKRFLTLAKWQATRNYLAAPLEDYSADQLRNVLRTRRVMDSWRVAMPRSEEDRLRNAYRVARVGGEAPDLVILTNAGTYSNLSPPSGAFALVYTNDSFRVFARK